MIGAFEDEDAAARACQVGGRGEAVVSGADDDVVESHLHQCPPQPGFVWAVQRMMRARNGVESRIEAITVPE